MGGVIGRIFNEFAVVVTCRSCLGLVSLTLHRAVLARAARRQAPRRDQARARRGLDRGSARCLRLRRRAEILPAPPPLILLLFFLSSPPAGCSSPSPRASSRRRISARSQVRTEAARTSPMTRWWRCRAGSTPCSAACPMSPISRRWSAPPRHRASIRGACSSSRSRRTSARPADRAVGAAPPACRRARDRHLHGPGPGFASRRPRHQRTMAIRDAGYSTKT